MYSPAIRSGWGLKPDFYLDEVQPVIASRCVVCHACTSGPCQLNMTSYEGIQRGINKHNPYADSAPDKVEYRAPTRLLDNLSIEEWRKRGFIPILPNGQELSTLALAVQFGKRNNVRNSEFSNERAREMAEYNYTGKYTCPANAEEYKTYIGKNSLGGMPWGLPSLTDKEHVVLTKWLSSGARGPNESARKDLEIPKYWSYPCQTGHKVNLKLAA